MVKRKTPQDFNLRNWEGSCVFGNLKTGMYGYWEKWMRWPRAWQPRGLEMTREVGEWWFRMVIFIFVVLLTLSLLTLLLLKVYGLNYIKKFLKVKHIIKCKQFNAVWVKSLLHWTSPPYYSAIPLYICACVCVCGLFQNLIFSHLFAYISIYSCLIILPVATYSIHLVLYFLITVILEIFSHHYILTAG